MTYGGGLVEVRRLWGPFEVCTGSARARGADLSLQLLRIHRSCSQSRLRYLRQTLPIKNGTVFPSLPFPAIPSHALFLHLTLCYAAATSMYSIEI